MRKIFLMGGLLFFGLSINVSAGSFIQAIESFLNNGRIIAQFCLRDYTSQPLKFFVAEPNAHSIRFALQEMLPTPLQEVRSIIEGRLAYNQILLEDNFSEPYKTAIKNDIKSYIFLKILLGPSMVGESPIDSVNLLYAYLSYFSEKDKDAPIAILLGVNPEHTERAYLNQIIELVNTNYTISPAYQNFHQYLDPSGCDICFKYSAEKSMARHIEKASLFFEEIKLIKTHSKDIKPSSEREDALLDKYIYNITNFEQNHPSMCSMFEQHCMQLKEKMNFADLRKGLEFMQKAPQLIYNYECYLQSATDQYVLATHFIKMIRAKNQSLKQEVKQEEKKRKEEKQKELEELCHKQKKQFDEAQKKLRIECDAQQRENERLKIERKQELDLQKCLVQTNLSCDKTHQDLIVKKEPKIKKRGAADPRYTSIVSAESIENIENDIPNLIQEFVEQSKNKEFEAMEKLMQGEPLFATQSSTENVFCFRFISPITKELIMFFAHKPHGSQAEKGPAAGWKKNMLKAFERAGMK